MPRLMEVLEFLDNSGRIMVKRVPEDGECEIRWGAQLTVRESQAAVFFRDGRALDVFGPGRHVLETQNIPVLTKWVTGFGYGPASPFRSEVYFLSTKLFPNLKWGTREPIIFRDSELQMVRLRAHGAFSIQISDPMLFLNKVVGTRGLFSDLEIEDYLRSIVLSRLTVVLAENFKSVFDLPASFDQLSALTRVRLGLDFAGLGLELHDFYVIFIGLPPEVQQMIDARAGMAAVGNLDDLMKFKTAMALETAAANPGGVAAAGAQMGFGVGLGVMGAGIVGQMLRQPDSPNTDPAAKLCQLKELFDAGVITRDEYEAKRKKHMEAL